MKKLLSILAVLCTMPFVFAFETLDLASVSNATGVIHYLNQFPFATTNISSFSQSELSKHQHAVLDILQKDFVSVETNALMCIADYISLGRPLSVENRDIDFINAIKHDRFVEFGDSNHVVRSGIIRHGPCALECRQRYRYRDRFNTELSRFRISAFRDVKYELTRERWNIYTEDEREALLEEFFRRANATDAEKQMIR